MKLLLICIAIVFSSCINKSNTIEINSVSKHHEKEIASASGVEKLNNKFYIIGDDTPFVYITDSANRIISKIQISKIDSINNGRTPKSIKADFEAIGKPNSDDLVIISSGSLEKTRDTVHIININTKTITSKNVRDLYNRIKQDAHIPETNEINIEGMAFSADKVFLLNRGNVSENLIIEMSKQQFLDYLKYDTEIPRFIIYKFILPRYGSVVAGFSGACIHPDNSGIIFSASMEDTNDEINDGEILGSLLGYTAFDELSEGKYIYRELMDDNGKLFELKVEGVCVDEYSSNYSDKLELVMVCDNDNGTSDIIKANVLINK